MRARNFWSSRYERQALQTSCAGLSYSIGILEIPFVQNLCMKMSLICMKIKLINLQAEHISYQGKSRMETEANDKLEIGLPILVCKITSRGQYNIILRQSNSKLLRGFWF